MRLLLLLMAMNNIVAWKGAPRSRLCMSFADGKANFLVDKGQEQYLATVLRRAIAGTQQLLNEGEKLIEVEFVADRKSDLSLSETLDTTLQFSYEFVKVFKGEGENLWVVLPDKKEVSLARKRWGETLPFTLTSIDSVAETKPAMQPALMVVCSPGFNIDEYINLVKAVAQAGQPPVVVINGNLDRLRNGYYPSFFYPGLARVSKEYFSQAVQVCPPG